MTALSVLTFNSQGEMTVKPVGRTITNVQVGAFSSDTTIQLTQMIIDLNSIIVSLNQPT